MNSRPPAAERRFTTRAQAEFRGGGRKRLAGAVVVALLGLVALVVFGPDEAEVKERFEYYGAPGELRIMKEISIEDGNDLKHQIPKSLRVPPPPARVEVEEEKSVEGFEPVPEKAEHDANELDVNTKNPLDNAESSEDFQVEMNLPMQTSDSFYLVHGPRPDYPLGATESERRTPVIAVKVGIFVGPDGHVSDVMILANDGGRAFEDAVRDVLREWKFAWLKEPGAGRWLQFTIRFKSPYFTPGR